MHTRDEGKETLHDAIELLEGVNESGIPLRGLHSILAGDGPVPAGNYDWLVSGINALSRQIPLTNEAPISALVADPVVLRHLECRDVETIGQLLECSVADFHEHDPLLSRDVIYSLQDQAEMRLQLFATDET